MGLKQIFNILFIIIIFISPCITLPTILEHTDYKQKNIVIFPSSDEHLETTHQQFVDFNRKTNLIIFSYKRPMQLYALLESLQEYVTGLNQIMVLYRADDERYEQAYNSVRADFENILFVQQSKYNPHSDFKPLCMDLLNSYESDYIMFATDDNLVKDYVSITDCIQALEQTKIYFNPQEKSIEGLEQIHAYGFYLRLGKNLHHCYPMNSQQAIPFLTTLNKSIFAWQIIESEGSLTYDWSYPNTVDMTIYPKQQIINTLQTIEFTNPNTLEGNWARLANHNSSKIGLCFERSKIVNIPMNRVQDVSPINRNMDQDPQELLELFEQGFKIDRSPLHQWQNSSAHAECQFVFKQR